MFSDVILAAWTGAGLAWWLIAWWLVKAERSSSSTPPVATPRQTLTVFKPLPPLRKKGLAGVRAGIESFVAQLEDDGELLLGVHEADRDLIAPFLEELRAKQPNARLKAIFRSRPDETANPKIAWQRYLAPHADGALWLWSDADIIAPADFLRSARDAFAKSGSRMMTFPYVVRKIPSPPSLLEALFVNVEFHPGVLLLRQNGPVDFGFGAAMLFRRDDFLHNVNWDEIGSQLADDFFLGQKLGPVVIGKNTLTTVSSLTTWTDAFLHDLRWSKTIRWSRPVGSVSRIVVMPVLGWLIEIALHPAHFLAWLGLAGMIQADVLAAFAICQATGLRLKWREIAQLEMWSLWRIVLWFLSWLPVTVAWSGRTWWRPQVELNREIKLTTT
jgi:ceramide glucosyltransferase